MPIIQDKLQQAIGEDVLDDRLVFRLNPSTNMMVYSQQHLARLLTVTQLETGHGRIEVQAYRITTGEFPRGVIYELETGLTSRQLLRGLRSDYCEVIQARPLGSHGAHPLKFKGQDIPRGICYCK